MKSRTDHEVKGTRRKFLTAGETACYSSGDGAKKSEQSAGSVELDHAARQDSSRTQTQSNNPRGKRIHARAVTQYTVILPNNQHHTLSAFLFTYYAEAGLIRLSRKTPHVARLVKWLRAVPRHDGSLEFSVVQPRTTDPHALDAVARLWRRILAMGSGKVDREEMYELVVPSVRAV